MNKIELGTILGIIFLIRNAVQVPLLNSGARIVGGENATIDEMPWQVSIHYYPINHCGGSIINEDTILTAAHCFDTVDKIPEAFRVRVGTHKRSVGGEMYNVKKIIIHPDFNHTTFNYDIAIIKLMEKLNFTDKVQPIQLPQANESLPIGKYGVASGFGKLGFKEGFPKILQKVNLLVLEEKVCQEKYQNVNNITSVMFCAGGDGIKDACGGDSGGPFVVDNKLIGIISYAIECALPQYPGVFARVSTLRNWIDEILNSE